MAEGLFGNLKNIGKGLIFEADDSIPDKTEKVAAATAEPMVQPRVVAATAENDPAYSALYGAVMDRDTGYARFLKAVKSLESVPMDSNTRYIAAREILKGNGVGLDQVLHSINVHVGILDSKKAEFAETVKSQENSGVKAMELECSDIEKSMQASRAQIARLQADISEQEKRKTSL